MNEKRTNIIFSIFFIIICIIFFVYSIKNQKNRLKNIYYAYPRLTYKDSIQNYILKKYDPEGFKYSSKIAFVTLDDYRKFRIKTNLNPNYSYKGISAILMSGDSLYKEKNNDTVYLYPKHYSKEFYFILHESK